MASNASKAPSKSEIAALAADLRMTLKPGKVTVSGGKYTVSVGASKKALTVGELIPASDAKKLAGKDVLVAVSGKTIAAIGRRVPGCYWIICYIPVPELFTPLLDELRNRVIDKYVNEKIITKQFAEQLRM
jgi:hypothetical protein